MLPAASRMMATLLRQRTLGDAAAGERCVVQQRRTLSTT
jgi:hypothetical protein